LVTCRRHFVARVGGQVSLCVNATSQPTESDKWHAMCNNCPIQLQDEHKGGGGLPYGCFENFLPCRKSKARKFAISWTGRKGWVHHTSASKEWNCVTYFLLCWDIISCSVASPPVWIVQSNTCVKRWQLGPTFHLSKLWQHRYLLSVCHIASSRRHRPITDPSAILHVTLCGISKNGVTYRSWVTAEKPATSYNALALGLFRLSWFYPQLRVDALGYTHPLRTEMWSWTSDAASWSFKGHVLTQMCNSFFTPGKTSDPLPVCSCKIHNLNYFSSIK
jgi:hypothetical protein